ncbi:hypothetical protein HID58_041955 [Brassica napus]|uniref:Uncharacterized protein n=1 Tax=Brassica napus TaxID=3708 RepID=A0ABQ8BDB9_BRANA|nr:hypothetical protein HID58_041955 [Brassica napus]
MSSASNRDVAAPPFSPPRREPSVSSLSVSSIAHPLSSMEASSPLETEPPISPPTEDKGYKCDPSLTLPPLLETNKRIPPPALKENGELRFPWAAKMNPKHRNLHRATSPTYLEDGTPMIEIPNHFASANSENPSHATDTHTSLSVTADESSLPSTMGDQTEAVTLPPLDDDNHNFSELKKMKTKCLHRLREL